MFAGISNGFALLAGSACHKHYGSASLASPLPASTCHLAFLLSSHHLPLSLLAVLQLLPCCRYFSHSSPGPILYSRVCLAPHPISVRTNHIWSPVLTVTIAPAWAPSRCPAQLIRPWLRCLPGSSSTSHLPCLPRSALPLATWERHGTVAARRQRIRPPRILHPKLLFWSVDIALPRADACVRAQAAADPNPW